MRNVIIQMWWNGVMVGGAVVEAHEQRWKLCLFLLVVAAFSAYRAWDSWKKEKGLPQDSDHHVRQDATSD
jgi:hypothetical protein